MGQYHKVYNVDKKQYIHGHRIKNGLRLMEQVGWIGSTSTALFLLLANSNGRGGGDAEEHHLIGTWAGDRIVIQGDYADETCQGYINEEKMEEFQDVSKQVLEMLLYCTNGYD